MALDWEVVDAGPLLAVDLDTVKNFLNIPLADNFFNDEKSAMVLVAQAAIEDHCQMVLPASTWVANIPAFYDAMRLIKRPFQSVTKVEYVDKTTGVITTLDPAYYLAGIMAQKCGVIQRAEGVAWPEAARRLDAVRITVSAGFTVLPPAVKQALLITIASVDKSRADGGGSSGGASRTVYAMRHQQGSSIVPMEAKALLNPYVYRTLGVS